MSLLLPAALIALIAAPVIVLLHMRRTTPRRIAIPATRFWPAADPEQTRKPRWRRPPLTLPLILQLIAAMVLAFALARPVAAWAGLGGVGEFQTTPRHLIVLLDGSTSMSATAGDGHTRYEDARADALRELETLHEGDVATVLVLGSRLQSFSATTVGEFRSLRERLAGLPAPGGRADLDSALALAGDLLLPDRDNRIAVFTDGAVAASAETTRDLGAPVSLHLFGDDPDNAAVVNIAFQPAIDAAHPATLYARIANFGAAAITAPVQFETDRQVIANQSVTIPAAGGSVEVTTPLPPGAETARVVLQRDDALPDDNVASIILQQSGDIAALRVLYISDAPSPLSRAIAALDGANLRVEPLSWLDDPVGLDNYDAIVLDNVSASLDQIRQWQRPVLIVNPLAGPGFTYDGTLAEPTISRVKAGDPLLTGVDLAGVTFGETPRLTLPPGFDEIVGAADGPFLARGSIGQQPAVLYAFDLNTSNLAGRVAFPILVANTLAALAPAPLPATVPLGDPVTIAPRAGAAEASITGPLTDTTTIPFVAPGDGEPLGPVTYALTGQPGEYMVREHDASGRTLAGGSFVVNAGHPRESDLRPNPDLAATLALAKAGPAAVTPATPRADLWPLLVLAALAVLALEWIAALWPRRGKPRFGPIGSSS